MGEADFDVHRLAEFFRNWLSSSLLTRLLQIRFKLVPEILQATEIQSR